MNKQINGAGEQLEDAFQLFNQFSEKLADSYSGLESQVVQLTNELAEARSERLIQLAEKEVLAKSLASLFDALPAGIVVLDSEGCIKQTNPIARQMMALKSENSKFNGFKWDDIASDIFISDGDELRRLIVGLLETDPRPAYADESQPDRVYGMRLYDFDLKWRVRGDTVEVLEIS